MFVRKPAHVALRSRRGRPRCSKTESGYDMGASVRHRDVGTAAAVCRAVVTHMILPPALPCDCAASRTAVRICITAACRGDSHCCGTACAPGMRSSHVSAELSLCAYACSTHRRLPKPACGSTAASRGAAAPSRDCPIVASWERRPIVSLAACAARRLRVWSCVTLGASASNITCQRGSTERLSVQTDAGTSCSGRSW